MQTIYKYKLAVTDFQQIELPLGAKVLSVGLDPSGDVCLWAKVHRKETATYDAAIAIVGTGNDAEMSDRYKFMGTVKQGPFMWHIFIYT